MRRQLLFLLLILCSFIAANAQVIINEFSASNLNSFLDSYGKTEDWIELYNNSDNAVDLSGWYLSDKASKPTKWAFPNGTTIAPRGYLLVYCSGRDIVANGEYHTSFKLTQTSGSDIVLLSNSNGQVQEQHDLGLTLVEHAHCRTTDGSSSWQICTQPTPGTSNNNSEQYLSYTATPSIDRAAGFYAEAQTVTITNNESNSTLHYTIDGTNPTTTSPVYTAPLTIDETQVVKARAYSNSTDILPGKMVFRTYFIDETFSLAVFSVAADQVIDLANGEGELIPIGSIEYFDTNRELQATSFGSLNRHGQDSWILDHRSLDWISRDEMGYSKAVLAPLFSYSERDEYQRFMFRNSGDDNYPAIDDGFHEGSTHIRDEFVQTLAMEGDMKLDIRAVERVILFLNGEYWGVYGMRERPVDHDYTKEYYDQDKYNLQYLSTWEVTEIEYGGYQAIQDWRELRDFALENDMSIPANYTVLEDNLNLTSLIDYMLMNLNVVASDWLNYNTGWWRGLHPDGDHKKWGYILWDLDATFDYYINYSGVPNISPSAQPCDLEDISLFMDDHFRDFELSDINVDTCFTIQNAQVPYPTTDTTMIYAMLYDRFCCTDSWDETCEEFYGELEDFSPSQDSINNDGDVGRHEKIFLKLLDESPQFQQLYYTRYADLMNTVFTCDNMLGTLDSMVAVIAPEMPRQIARWGGSMGEWQRNLDDLRDFIRQRCELLDDGAIDCYDDLTTTYPIVLRTEPDGVGEIDFNSLDIEEFPWQGDYFAGITNNIKAKVFDEQEDTYRFSHWRRSSGEPILPNVESRRASMQLNSADTLTAVFELIDPNSVVQLSQRYAVQLYPNPAAEVINLYLELDEAANVHARLFNGLGQLVKDYGELLSSSNTGASTTPLSLPPTAEVYWLEIRIGALVERFRVVKVIE